MATTDKKPLMEWEVFEKAQVGGTPLQEYDEFFVDETIRCGAVNPRDNTIHCTMGLGHGGMHHCHTAPSTATCRGAWHG